MVSKIKKMKWNIKKIITLEHNIIVTVVHKSLLLRNQEKLLALPVYSFQRVATSGIRNNYVSSSSSYWTMQPVLKWEVNVESLRIQQSTAVR